MISFLTKVTSIIKILIELLYLYRLLNLLRPGTNFKFKDISSVKEIIIFFNEKESLNVM